MQGQLLNQITNEYANLSVAWLDALLPLAQHTFVLLATIELAWSGIWWAFIARKDENLIANLVHKVFVIMFFYTLLLFAPSWISFIVSGFITAGSTASGYSSLNPSSVLQVGLDTSVLIWETINSSFSWHETPLDLYMAAPFVAIAFAVIAGFMVVTLVEAYLVIGGGVLMLGFAGSRWTATLAEGYVLYAVKVGVRLLVLYLLIGAGMSLPQTWIDMIQSFPEGAAARRSVIYEIVGSSLVLALVVWRAPMFASSMVYYRANLGMDRSYQDVG